MRLPRYERTIRLKGYRELSELREAGDLDTLRSYVEDPDAPLRKRRRAAQFFCTCAPGGGGRGYGFTPTDPAIIPTCIRLLETETDASIRRWATFGLRQSFGPEVEKGLILALDSDDAATRNHALIGLAVSGSTDAVAPISSSLPDPKTKEMAIRALVSIGGTASIEALKAAAETHPADARNLLKACAEIEADGDEQP